jgi:hypothetical protein
MRMDITQETSAKPKNHQVPTTSFVADTRHSCRAGPHDGEQCPGDRGLPIMAIDQAKMYLDTSG